MKKRCVIVGGGGGTKLAHNALVELGYDTMFFDTYAETWRNIRPSIAKTVENALVWSNGVYFVATGASKLREERTKALFNMTGKMPITIIHPHTVISRYATLGAGVFICDSVSVGPDAVLGDSVVLNECALVPHDCTLANYCLIAGSVSLAGYVTVEKYAMVGIGATVLPHITIGEGAMVAAGSMVIKDVAPYTMVAGVPAVYKKDWEPK